MLIIVLHLHILTTNYTGTFQVQIRMVLILTDFSAECGIIIHISQQKLTSVM